MTIAELGALEEFIGSIAVLLTLVYLALQIRHSKELLERHEKISLSQVYQARVDSRRELEKLVIEESMAKIFLKSRPFSSEETEELTELEELRVRQLHSLWMDWWDNTIYQESLGLLDTKDMGTNALQFEMLLKVWESFDLRVPPRILHWYN